MEDKACLKDIRIGTLVGSGMKAPEYIKQILPHGFESFSLTFYPNANGIEWEKLAEGVSKELEGSDAVVSSLGIYGNPLESGADDKAVRKSWEDCIDSAHLFGCDIVAGFAGRLRGKPIHESIQKFKEVFTPLAERAKEKGIRIAFENCNMGGTWESGDCNIAHNPTAWELMFDAVPHDNMGLQWEPCHQMVALIDPMPQLREWVSRIFHVHGKDATIHWDVVKKYGVLSSAHGKVEIPGANKTIPMFAYHRTPGFGDSNWTDIISDLRMGGFKGSIDIEGWHDPVYKESLEMTGQVRALNYLKECRGGAVHVDVPEE